MIQSTYITTALFGLVVFECVMVGKRVFSGNMLQKSLHSMEGFPTMQK
jgi:hypothetical protein